LQTRKILEDNTTISTLHDVRMAIDAIKKNASAGEYNKLMEIRKIIDDKLKENPNRAKNDKIYARERTELTELSD
jgi:hypothetical protein